MQRWQSKLHNLDPQPSAWDMTHAHALKKYRTQKCADNSDEVLYDLFIRGLSHADWHT